MKKINSCSVLCGIYFAKTTHQCHIFYLFTTILGGGGTPPLTLISRSFSPCGRCFTEEERPKPKYVHTIRHFILAQVNMGYITPSVCTYFTFSFPVFFVVVVSRPMVPQLAPPKIPEGERVDFDVSGRIKVRCC